MQVEMAEIVAEKAEGNTKNQAKTHSMNTKRHTMRQHIVQWKLQFHNTHNTHKRIKNGT